MSYRSLRKFKQAQREWDYQQDRKQDAHLDDEPALSEFEKAAEWDDSHWERVDYPRTDRQYGGGFA